MGPRWIIPAAATVAGVATAAAQASASPIIVVAAVIGGLLTSLIIFLSVVAVYGSRLHSTRAIRVLTLLAGRAKAHHPKRNESGPSS
jgi:hypothetical protein